jgi:hypothetical protein
MVMLGAWRAPTRTLAQASATPPAAPAPHVEPEPPLRLPNEPYSWVPKKPLPPPPVGACIGGDCGGVPTVLDLARARPGALPTGGVHKTPRRERFAYTGAVFGTVSAALVLGGSIGIALADDLASERVTRGVFLGYLSVATPLVALSVFLARREGKYEGYQALRRFGWLSYGLGVSDGALLWASAFRHEESPRLLTIAAGAFGALSLLPHALEALSAARNLRTRRWQQRLHASATGLTIRF